MKKILTSSLIAVTVLLNACSKVVTFEPNAEEIGLYSKVYIPRAERPVEAAAISTSGDVLTYSYNAYLGGPVSAPADINVTFSVNQAEVDEYNSKNGTHYQLLPESSYSLEATSAVIPSGKRATGNFKVNVTPGNYLTMFQTYLLPLSISKANGSTINEELATAYFVFTVTFLPGQVPREKVLSLGANWGNILTAGSRGSLIRRDINNDILLYLPDSTGKFTIAPREIGDNWAASESFYLVNDSTVVVRNYPYWAGLFSFTINENYDLFGANPFWLGDFWDKYVIITYKDYFLTVDANGVMRRQPAFTNVDNPKTDVGTGFNGFSQILAYQSNLLATDAEGNLWLYPMSDDAMPSTRRKVGTGWNMYVKIIVLGDDVLALDDQGDVYRYEFNPDGFYPLQ